MDEIPVQMFLSATLSFSLSIQSAADVGEESLEKEKGDWLVGDRTDGEWARRKGFLGVEMAQTAGSISVSQSTSFECWNACGSRGRVRGENIQHGLGELGASLLAGPRRCR